MESAWAKWRFVERQEEQGPLKLSLCLGIAGGSCWQTRWAESRSGTASTSIRSVLTAALCSFPRWKLLRVVSESGGPFWPVIAHTSTHGWQHGGVHIVFPRSPGAWWGPEEARCRHALEQGHSLQLFVAWTYHSSMAQSLGNTLVAIAKVVLKHGNNITEHNNLKRKKYCEFLVVEHACCVFSLT